MLSNTLRLNFYYLKIVLILHPRYHPKIIGHILKNRQKKECLCIRAINHNEIKMKMKNRSHRNDLGLDMNTNIVNVKVSQYDDAYVY